MTRLQKLLSKSQKRSREERASGISRKGRKSMFDEGLWVGGLIKDWGGLMKIPQYIRETFPKPKSKQGKIDFDLGVEYGKKNR